MYNILLHSLDVFFLVFHTLVILFNVFGWIVPRWRTLNFISLSITAFSWFILGIWYGWGYCFCTDWHWQVRQRLGYHDGTNSYIQFLVYHLTGFDASAKLVDTVTVVVFIAAYAVSISLMRKKWRSG